MSPTKIAIASFIQTVFLVLAGYVTLNFPRKRSVLRIYIGLSMWALAVITGSRGLLALLYPDGFSIFSANMIQIVTFSSLYYIMLANGFGMLLLTKENSDSNLRESEEKIRLLLNSAAEGIYGLDMEGNCTFCNNSCIYLLGYKHQDELLGKNMHWQIHSKYQDGKHFPIEECRIFQAFNKGEGSHVDDEVLWHADGTSFPAEYWSYPQFYDGRVVGAVVTFLDITERKRHEIQMKNHEQELIQISTSLATANKKLSLLSSITRHDINNKVIIIQGFLRFAQKAKNIDDAQHFLDKIHDSVKGIIQQIDFSKNYQDIGTKSPKWLNFSNMIIFAHNPALHIIDETGTLLIFADPLFENVLYNLIDNTIRHGETATEVHVTVVTEKDQIRIIWTDNGVGVPEDKKEMIFQKGYGKNTGFGLFLIREILAITGMIIQETGEPGKGARFEITVPNGKWRFGDNVD